MEATTHRPYDVEQNDYVGTILRIHSVAATVPDDLLPRRVRLMASWRREGGCNLRSWYADHDSGIISFPTVAGDGTQSLKQLIDWLEARGYREITDPDDPNAIYERIA
jgi:hypothetical protein